MPVALPVAPSEGRGLLTKHDGRCASQFVRVEAVAARRGGARSMTNLDLAPHRRGTTQEIGGQEVVLAYADVNAEYDALRGNAIVVDRSHRGRIRFFGEKAGEALTGLVTNDVLAMHAGHGQYGAALSAKGRIV